MLIAEYDFLQSGKWQEFSQQCLNYYAKTQLQLIFKKVETAEIDIKARVCYWNTQFPTSKKQQALRNSNLVNFHENICRAVMGHEAGHLRWTPAFDDLNNDEFEIFNAIEDERMERLQIAEHPELDKAFELIGDMQLERQMLVTANEAVLLWRWCHDHPWAQMTTNDPQLWESVKPLVERAWESNPDECKDLAKKITKVLNHKTGSSQLLGSLTASHDPNSFKSSSLETANNASEKGSQETLNSETKHGSGAGTKPSAPIDPQEYDLAAIQRLTYRQANTLARHLKMLSESHVVKSSFSKGRFSYRRFLADKAYMITKKKGDKQKKIPLKAVCIILDISGSMKKDFAKYLEAVVCIMTACQMANVEFKLTLFNDEFRTITGYWQQMNALSRVRPRGGTTLHPALENAIKTLPEAKKQTIFVITDGSLREGDANLVKSLIKTSSKKVRFLPLILNAEAHHSYVEIFPTIEICKNLESLKSALSKGLKN